MRGHLQAGDAHHVFQRNGRLSVSSPGDSALNPLVLHRVRFPWGRRPDTARRGPLLASRVTVSTGTLSAELRVLCRLTQATGRSGFPAVSGSGPRLRRLPAPRAFTVEPLRPSFRKLGSRLGFTFFSGLTCRGQPSIVSLLIHRKSRVSARIAGGICHPVRRCHAPRRGSRARAVPLGSPGVLPTPGAAAVSRLRPASGTESNT